MTYKGFLITLAMSGNRSTALVRRERGCYLWRVDPLFLVSDEKLVELAKQRIDGYLATLA